MSCQPSPGQTTTCTALHYRIVAVPLRPAQISDSSQIAGTVDERKAATWTEEKGLRIFAVPAGYSSAQGVGLNSSGEVIGVAVDRDGDRHRALVFRRGKPEVLAGERSKATAINDDGEIVGSAKLAGKAVSGAVLWKRGKAIALGGCCGGTATGINRRGQVVGEIYDEEGSYSAFLWDEAHGVRRLGTSKSYSSAIAINEAGHVLVQEFSEGIFLYQDGQFAHLNLSAKYTSDVRAISDCDAVVGGFGPFADAYRAFVWDKNLGFRDLNDLVPGGSGWKLEVATSINNRGEIVGWGDYQGKDGAGFLLVPQN